MAYDVKVKFDPPVMPLKPALLILMHRRKKAAFVCYTSNARGRAAVLASAIRHRDDAERAHLRDLPEGEVKDFALLATRIGLEPKVADEAVDRLCFDSSVTASASSAARAVGLPVVTFNSCRMTLAAAPPVEAKTSSHYQTVYRRLQRGWPLKAALDLEER